MKIVLYAAIDIFLSSVHALFKIDAYCCLGYYIKRKPPVDLLFNTV